MILIKIDFQKSNDLSKDKNIFNENVDVCISEDSIDTCNVDSRNSAEFEIFIRRKYFTFINEISCRI